MWKSPKFYVFIWRMRWSFLTSFGMLKQWGIQAPNLCLLCGEQKETTSHLFYNYYFSKRKLIKMPAITDHTFWRKANSSATGLTYGNIRIGDIMDIMKSFIPSPGALTGNCWRLHWALLGASSWHVQERNRIVKLNQSRPQKDH